ncbi:MAG: polysaccharide biosynthesis/export family protein [Bacteroidales bacterium]|nr:polysaccharide biosynthesis/export family protein [Bacteroidales bacterium]
MTFKHNINHPFTYFLILFLLFVSSCSSQEQLAYLSNLPEEDAVFPMDVPDYQIQNRDVLYITVKAMTTDGTINDFLMSSRMPSGNYMSNEAGYYVYGYDVTPDGDVLIPSVGAVNVVGLTLDEARKKIQERVDKVFRNSTVECKLLSFKFTVIGEVKVPGTYVNYNNRLTVLEAIGRAGGVGDYGRRDKIQVVRPYNGGSKTYNLNLQDKELLSSEAYFLLPNDVVIVEPQPKKIFNLNLPTYSFIISTVTSAITSTLLIINYIKK